MSRLKMWVGPMFSRKSGELIAEMEQPLYAHPEKVGLFQPQANTRDEGIVSRSGKKLEATKILSLFETLEREYAVVGIDEIHLFDVGEAPAIRELLCRGTEVNVAGLNLDYRGALFPIIARLFEMPNITVFHKQAVCTKCKCMQASYTQIFLGNEPILEGLNSAMVQDSSLRYEAACSKHFVSNYFS